MAARRRDLAGPLGLHLADHVSEVELFGGVLTGRLAHHLDGLDLGHRFVSKKGDQLADRGHAEHVDAVHQLGLTRLPERDDHPGDAGLGGRQRGRQDSAYGTDSAVQTELAEQCGPAELIGREHLLGGQNGGDDRRGRSGCRPWAGWPG